MNKSCLLTNERVCENEWIKAEEWYEARGTISDAQITKFKLKNNTYMYDTVTL